MEENARESWFLSPGIFLVFLCFFCFGLVFCFLCVALSFSSREVRFLVGFIIFLHFLAVQGVCLIFYFGLCGLLFL